MMFDFCPIFDRRARAIIILRIEIFFVLFILYIFLWAPNLQADLRPTQVRCEYLVNPLGIDVRAPRLSWILQTDGSRHRGERETAYHILVASSAEKLATDKGDLWDSGKIESDENTQIRYAGQPLQSRMECYWKVRVWDENGKLSSWSEPAMWSMGLLDKADWKANWIGSEFLARNNSKEKGISRPLPWFRKVFTLKTGIKKATAYVSSLGYHELYVNGRKVGDQVLSPAVSQLDKRAIYNTYDISECLIEGKNCIGLWLGYGWFRKSLPGTFYDSPLVIAEIDILLSNGQIVQLGTDGTWKTHPSPLSVINLHPERGITGTESYDATKEIPGWCAAQLDDKDWVGVKIIPTPPITISAQKVQPNRIACTIKPVSIEEILPGVYEFDMGRNFVGYFELRMHAARGDRVVMEMSELELGSKQRLNWGQTDEYIARGVGEETFRNHFDYRGFRWVKIKGLQYKPKIKDATGYLIHTDFPRVGKFECSNILFNQIYETVLWTYLCCSLGGNIVDCPHRERLGYGAEGQASMVTAMTNFDSATLFTHWLEVWRDAQNQETGAMPHTAPLADPSEGSPGWGGICVALPWELYLRYGDKQILEVSFPSIKKWISFLNSKSEDHVLQHYGPETWGFFADWVAPGRQLKSRWTNAVDKQADVFFNNCYYIYNVQLAAKIAHVLGKFEDAELYEEQAQIQRRALHKRYYDSQRQVYVNGEEAYQAFALLTGVIPDELRSKLESHLELLIKEARKGHLNTGVLGTFFLLKYLLQEDHNDLIFEMASQRTFPGWGYLLEQGATTFGEQWGGLHSQIHTSFLSIGSWFIEGIGGIQVDEKSLGYKHFSIKPGFVGDLTWAKTSYNSIRGKIVSNWKREEDGFRLEIAIPVNTTATVYIPTDNPSDILESGRPATQSEGVNFVRMEKGWAVCNIQSGEYSFVSKKDFQSKRSKSNG